MTAAGERPAGNLPVTVTRFIGRRRELAEVRRLIAQSRLVTLTGVDVSVEAAGPVKGVRLAPDGGDLPFTQRDGRVAFTLPSLRGYQMVEIGY